jgi:excisionase family DNA binding protein
MSVKRDYLTTGEVAKMLNMPKRSVTELAGKGEIPTLEGWGRSHYRYPRQGIEELQLKWSQVKTPTKERPKKVPMETLLTEHFDNLAKTAKEIGENVLFLVIGQGLMQEGIAESLVIAVNKHDWVSVQLEWFSAPWIEGIEKAMWPAPVGFVTTNEVDGLLAECLTAHFNFQFPHFAVGSWKDIIGGRPTADPVQELASDWNFWEYDEHHLPRLALKNPPGVNVDYTQEIIIDEHGLPDIFREQLELRMALRDEELTVRSIEVKIFKTLSSLASSKDFKLCPTCPICKALIV